jgi:hypothetical protein
MFVLDNNAYHYGDLAFTLKKFRKNARKFCGQEVGNFIVIMPNWAKRFQFLNYTHFAEAMFV